MKRPLFAVIAVFLACFAVASAAAQSPYTGDGGRGKTLAVMLPDGVGLAKDETAALPIVVQGILVEDMKKYSALTVIDRQNLENVVKETESGIYKNEQDFVKLGGVTHADYIMTGKVIKMPSGYTLQVQVSETAQGATLVSRSVSCTAAELENFTGIRKAVQEVFTGLGIQLTDASKQELAKAANQAYINAQTALAQGITAQKGGTVVEALSRYIQAANYDPALAEAASRLNILSANVSSGNIGEDTRNDIAWRREWVKRLQEAEAFFSNYTKENQPYYLVYDTEVTQGKVDYQKETVELSFPLYLLPDSAWASTINEVMGMVKEGLEATGRAEKPWELDWPTTSIGKPGPFASQVKNYAVLVEILNSSGKSIGRQTVNMEYGYRCLRVKKLIEGYSDDYVKEKFGGMISPAWDGKTVVFPAVDANSITDRLDIRISSIDGVPAANAAKQKKISIVPEAEYNRIPGVLASGMDTDNLEQFEFGTVNYRAWAAQHYSGKNWVMSNYKGLEGNVVVPIVFGIIFDSAELDDYYLDTGIMIKKRITSITLPNSLACISGGVFSSYPPGSITIGRNVVLTYHNFYSRSDYVYPFGKEFVELYDNNGRKAGTYTKYSSRNWTYNDPQKSAATASNQPTAITIPNGTTSIKDREFWNKNLTHVTFPNGVTSIGDSAFSGNQLTSVIIPNSVTSIEFGAFFGNQLTSVTIGANVNIGDRAFDSGFLDVYTQNGRKTGTYTKNGDTWLYNGQQVSAATGTTSIKDFEFNKKKLTSVTIPNSVTSIGAFAFSENQLTSVTIPSSVTSIGTMAFFANQLTSVTIPNSVTSIGNSAFGRNQLTSVTIPNSVTTIGGNPFSGNAALKEIRCATNNPVYTSVDGILFSKDTKTLVAYPEGKGTSYTIPNSVSVIGNNAFYNSQLASVTIPSSVTTIGNCTAYAELAVFEASI